MVLGDDRSVCADLAWLWLNSHRWPGWRLEVVTATEPDHFPPPVGEQPVHEWHPVGARQSFAESCIDQVTYLTTQQDPRLALSRHADLLVIGSRGGGLAKKLHLGSTAEWLLARPPAPMIIARHGRTTARVVVCHDGSVHSYAALRTFCSFPWAAQVECTLAVVDDGRVDVPAAIDGARAMLEIAGVATVDRVLHGEPGRELRHLIGRLAPDLVVLGTRGLTGLQRFRVGSTATAIAHGVPASVLVDHAPEGDLEALEG